MARRRRHDQPVEAPPEPGSDDLFPEDYLAPFWTLATDVQWPYQLRGEALLA